MIPFSILSGKLIEKNKHTQEFRVLDLSPDSFTFRLAEPLALEEVRALEMTFFLQTDHALHSASLEKESFLLQSEPDEDGEVPWEEGDGISRPFWYIYRVTTEEEEFIRLSKQLMKEYLGYIRLKQAGDDQAMMEKLTGFSVENGGAECRGLLATHDETAGNSIQGMPDEAAGNSTQTMQWEKARVFREQAEEKKLPAGGGWSADGVGSNQYAANWQEQSHALTEKLLQEPKPEWLDAYMRVPSLAISLENPDQWELFLQMDFEEFLERRWGTASLDESGKVACQDGGWRATCLRARRPDTICIGNPYCSILFPDEEKLEEIVDKCQQLGLQVVLVMAPVRELEWDRMKDRIDHAMTLEGKQVTHSCGQKACEPPEIMVNDLGKLRYLAEHYPKAAITMGTLLTKRKKDVRRKWAWNEPADGEVPEFYQEYLRYCYHISGMAMDVDGSNMRLPRSCGMVSLTAPFYQMNTAGNCTLYAICRSGDRGRQEAVTECPDYCRNQVLLYPKRLGMVGRYNSLLGYDDRLLTDGAYLRTMLERGMGRLIINL